MIIIGFQITVCVIAHKRLQVFAFYLLYISAVNYTQVSGLFNLPVNQSNHKYFFAV